jgi:hypothetical protein
LECPEYTGKQNWHVATDQMFANATGIRPEAHELLLNGYKIAKRN